MVVVDHNASVFPRRPKALYDVPQPVTKVAGAVVSPCYIPRSRFTSQPSFGRQCSGQPVRLSSYVVVDLGEPKGFEPRRSSWAHISEPIPSIHNDGTILVEATGSLLIKVLYRNVDRTFYMLVFEHRWR